MRSHAQAVTPSSKTEGAHYGRIFLLHKIGREARESVWVRIKPFKLAQIFAGAVWMNPAGFGASSAWPYRAYCQPREFGGGQFLLLRLNRTSGKDRASQRNPARM